MPEVSQPPAELTPPESDLQEAETITVSVVSKDQIIEKQVAPLSDEDRTELDILQHQIDESKEAFLQMVRAMKVIHEKRLYREQFDTFEDYCRVTLGMDKRYAYYHINAARVIESLQEQQGEHSVHILPTSESQVRCLKQFNSEQQRKLWDESVKAAGNKVPSRSVVERVVRACNEDLERPDEAYEAERWVFILPSAGKKYIQYRGWRGKVLSYDDEIGVYKIALPGVVLEGVPPKAIIAEQEEKSLGKAQRAARQRLFKRLEALYKVSIEGEDADCLGALMAYFHTRPAKKTKNKAHDMKLTDFEEQVLSMVEERVRAQEALSSGDEEE